MLSIVKCCNPIFFQRVLVFKVMQVDIQEFAGCRLWASLNFNPLSAKNSQILEQSDCDLKRVFWITLTSQEHANNFFFNTGHRLYHIVIFTGTICLSGIQTHDQQIRLQVQCTSYREVALPTELSDIWTKSHTQSNIIQQWDITSMLWVNISENHHFNIITRSLKAMSVYSVNCHFLNTYLIDKILSNSLSSGPN